MRIEICKIKDVDVQQILMGMWLDIDGEDMGLPVSNLV